MSLNTYLNVFTYVFFYRFIVLQLLLLQPGVVKTDAEPPSLKSLVMDPYIIIAAGNVFKTILAGGEKKNTEILTFGNLYRFRCHNIRQHGDRNARTVVAHMDDGYDGRWSVEARGDVFTSQYILFDRNESVWATRTSYGKVHNNIGICVPISVER